MKITTQVGTIPSSTGEATTTAASRPINFKIYKYADVNTKTSVTCDKMGTEFRPLGELDKYLRPNPFQDPNRGRIQQKLLTSSATTDLGKFTKKILRNQLISLSGKDSILGRGIKAEQLKYKTGTTTIDTTYAGLAIGCCVVGKDVPPKGNAASYHYHDAGHGHSYGGHTHHATAHTHTDGHGYGIG